MGGRKSADYPRTLGAFYRRFHDDDACLRYVVKTRRPDGFRCPKCGVSDAGRLTTSDPRCCGQLRQPDKQEAAHPSYPSEQAVSVRKTTSIFGQNLRTEFIYRTF